MEREQLILDTIKERYLKHVNPEGEDVQVVEMDETPRKYGPSYRVYSKGVVTHYVKLTAFKWRRIIDGTENPPRIGSDFFQPLPNQK